MNKVKLINKLKESILKLLRKILKEYPYSQGILFFSLDYPLELSIGKGIEILRNYKDLPILSIDEGFSTEFNYIMFKKGSIITLFMDYNCFVSIYVHLGEPNKELAREIFLKYKTHFSKLIKIYEP